MEAMLRPFEVRLAEQKWELTVTYYPNPGVRGRRLLGVSRLELTVSGW